MVFDDVHTKHFPCLPTVLLKYHCHYESVLLMSTLRAYRTNLDLTLIVSKFFVVNYAKLKVRCLNCMACEVWSVFLYLLLNALSETIIIAKRYVNDK